MGSDEIKKEINELGLSEKLLLVEDIWDSLAADDSEIAMPAWQKSNLIKDTNNTRKENMGFIIGRKCIKGFVMITNATPVHG